MSNRRKKIAYWVLVLLVTVPTAGSAVPELLGHGPAQTVESLLRLGYPLYLMKILGLAKILGAVVLLVNRPSRLTEWAYAGFAILFLGATASHLLAGDATHAPFPAVFLALLLVAYALHEQARNTVGHTRTR